MPKSVTTKQPVKTRIRALVAALRKPRAKQTRECLRRTTASEGALPGMCCLGVATEVYRKATGKGKWKASDIPGRMIFVIEGDKLRKYHAETTLSPSVRDWYGFSTDDPFLDVHNVEAVPCGVANATTCNDRYGMSLPKIADAFEATFLKPTPRAKTRVRAGGKAKVGT